MTPEEQKSVRANVQSHLAAAVQSIQRGDRFRAVQCLRLVPGLAQRLTNRHLAREVIGVARQVCADISGGNQ